MTRVVLGLEAGAIVRAYCGGGGNDVRSGARGEELQDARKQKDVRQRPAQELPPSKPLA